MGVLRKLKCSLATVGLVERPQASGKAGGQQPGPLPGDETLRRLRRDYLHSLGIHAAKAPHSGGGAAVAPAPPVPTCFTETTEEEEDCCCAVRSCVSSPSLGGGRAGSGRREAEEEAPTLLRQSPKSFSTDDFRINFLRKLSYSKVWVPAVQRPPKSQNVLIFDWDDTLLCTSYMNLFGGRSLPPSVARCLPAIGRAARQLLELAARMGQTFIITNAMCGWVEHSAEKWAPELLPALQRVRIISARSRFEPEYPDVHQWKIQAFLEVQRQLDSQVITNLLSIGDSDFEMDAVHVMGSQFAQALVKTVKFRPNPCPEDLLKELSLVLQKFKRIVETGRHLKVCLDRRPCVERREA